MTTPENTVSTPQDLLASFVANMPVLRAKLDMTQTDLAKLVKSHGLPFHQQTIQRIENGERPVRLDEAFAIALHLNATLAEMVSPGAFVENSPEVEMWRTRSLAAEDRIRAAVGTLTQEQS